MSCGENNKKLIVNIQYIESSKIPYDLALQASGHNLLSYSAIITSQNKQFLNDLIFDASSAEVTFTPTKSTGGTKFKNNIKFNMLCPNEDSSDEFTQLNKLEQETYSFIIEYFGGEKSFIYSPVNCMLHTYQLNDGKYECSIEIENLTAVQPLIIE